MIAPKVDAVLAELDALSAVGFIKAHLADLRAALTVTAREGGDPTFLVSNYLFVGAPGAATLNKLYFLLTNRLGDETLGHHPSPQNRPSLAR